MRDKIELGGITDWGIIFLIVVIVTVVTHGQNVSNCTVYICVVYYKSIFCDKADKNKEYGAYVRLSPLVGQRNPPSNK